MSERERINEVLDKASEWELHIIRIFVEGYAGKGAIEEVGENL